MPASSLARLYAWAGDNDSAFSELGQLLETAGHVQLLKRDPNFFPLRGDPRFEALLDDPKNNQPLF